MSALVNKWVNQGEGPVIEPTVPLSSSQSLPLEGPYHGLAYIRVRSCKSMVTN
jgi:hypothetical protein